MKSTKVLSRLLLITFSLFLSCCDKAHSIPDNFFKDKNWTIWSSDEEDISIYVEAGFPKIGYLVRNFESSKQKYVVNMDAYIGISGFYRPWYMEIKPSYDEHGDLYRCKRMRNNDQFIVDMDDKDVTFTSHSWDESEIDISLLFSFSNESLNIYFGTYKEDVNQYENLCFVSRYKDDVLYLCSGENKSFVMHYKDSEATGYYSRKENTLDFQFETNEIFEDLTHLEFKC